MRIYLVGGAVRDSLLKIQSHDRDWVVEGATIQEMLDAGFKQVGKEFPVFLHPETNEEYALARKEKKTGDKHTDFEFDFSPNVTLEEDLARRDFTINAFVLDSGDYIRDYFHGFDDLKNKLIRAIRPETFIEDPLRVLRGCRFAAQLDFNIEPNTMDLFKKMVRDGMLSHLAPERVWKETEKALTSGYSSEKYFELLNECGALEVMFPEIYKLVNTPEQIKYHPSGNTFKHTMIALSRVKNESSLTKFIVLCHDLGKGTTPENILPQHIKHDERGIEQIDLLCDRLKVPNIFRGCAKTFCKHHMRMAKFDILSIKKQYDLVQELSSNFKNQQLLQIYNKCFYADYNGEEKLTKYNDPLIAKNIIHQINNVFDIMEGITLKDLPEKIQKNLMKQKYEKIGILYRENMIKYLKEKLKERETYE